MSNFKTIGKTIFEGQNYRRDDGPVAILYGRFAGGFVYRTAVNVMMRQSPGALSDDFQN